MTSMSGMLARLKRIGAVRDERGQMLIETALTVPLFALLLLGAVEFGRVAYAAIQVQNAANAGAQYGSQSSATSGDTTGIQTAAQKDAGNLGGLTATSSVSETCSDGSTYSDTTQCPGAHVVGVLTVNTSCTVNVLIHAPGFGSTFTLQGQAIEDVLVN